MSDQSSNHAGGPVTEPQVYDTGHQHGHAIHDDHDHKPGFVARWLFSTNHKDIGTLYFGFSLVAVFFALIFSIIMRAELQAPGA
jgi:cytochrome c oxidase subunit 1